MKEQIKAALEEVRPMLQADGGDVEFVDYTDDHIVLVRLKGHCAGCPFSQMTVKAAIEDVLKEQFAEIASVQAVQ